MKLLQGLTVLVTKTAPSGQQLCEQIEQAGGSCLWLPSIAIAPPPHPAALAAQAKTLHDQAVLIFLSAHAVAGVAAFWPSPLPASKPAIKIIAIGDATRNALMQLDANMEVLTPLVSNSEGVLAMPELQKVKDLKITLIKGVGGRELLEETLLQRGAKLSVLAAYQRIKPTIVLEPFESLMQNNSIDAMVCGSFESVKNLTEIFKTNTGFRSIPLIVISDRVQVLAQTLGFQTVWVATNASHEALLSVLLEKRETIWRKKSLHNQKM